jgi:predicted Zn-dependent protease
MNRFRSRCIARLLVQPLVQLLALAMVLNPVVVSAENTLPNLGDTERGVLSPVVERRLGEEIMRDVWRDPDYLDDAPLLEYLDRFGNSLVSSYPGARGEANYEFSFFTVRDPAINAFALPGGFIGVHSGLILAAQTESELASVLAHEIGHVAQRHIARGLGQQQQDVLIPLAAVLLAVLASRSSGGDAAIAAIEGGQGLALQRQLNFSRDLEREADRVGFQILRDAKFDTSGMVAFFGRLQTASRGYSESVPAYLSSHPLTTERIADISGRVRDQRYKQHVDSLDFHLIRARARVLQDQSAQGLVDTEQIFQTQLLQHVREQVTAAKYGMAVIALKRGELGKAQQWLQDAKRSAGIGVANSNNSIFASLAIDIKLAPGQAPELVRQALPDARAAHVQYPLSRGIARQLADALSANGQQLEAATYLRDQIQLYRSEPKLQQQLAKVYADQGKLALQHMALAEAYFLQGTLQSALDQLNLARRAGDATFYDQSVIDARERELQARRKEELKEKKR